LAVGTAPEAKSCVFVRNLPNEEWKLEAVRRIFSPCGPILAIRLPKKGKAAIRFKTGEAAAAAAARDGEERAGKKLRVLLTSEVIHAYIHMYIPTFIHAYILTYMLVCMLHVRRPRATARNVRARSCVCCSPAR